MPKAVGGIVQPDFLTLASGQPVVVCRTTVQRGALSTPVTLLFPQPGEAVPSERDLDAVLAQDPRVGVPAVLQASGEGEAAVVARGADAACTELVAMAAAVCAASWGWDETPIVRVDVNGTSLLVEPRYAGVDEQWQVVIVARTDPRD